MFQQKNEYKMPPGVIKGPSAWHGSSIKFSKDWIRPFSSGELCELDTAMREIKARGLDIVNILKKDFTLPTLGPIFEKIRFDLLNKRGFILMRGIPVEDYTIEEIAGGTEVMENGGQVKVLTFEDGVSTTGIIERITQNKLR